MADGKVTIETILDSREFNKAVRELSGTTKKGLKVVTEAVASTATALGGLGLLAIKQGIAFESAFAGVKKTVDATDKELAEFEQGIRDMAKSMPQSATAIASVAEAAGQLGIKNENLLQFTKTMVMLGDATNMTSDEAATALARFANITGMSQDNFDKLGSTIVALGNNLATTESEIVDMAMRIAGAGHQVGLTEAQIMSFSGALSSVGIEAEAGGTAFSNLISKMNLATQKGGDQLEQFASVAGMSADEFKKAFEEDAAGAIISFIKGLDNINKNGGSAIKTLDEIGLSDIRMRDALLRASGASDVFSKALSIGTKAWSENTALTHEAEERYKTLESRLGIFKNTITDIGISLYKSVDTPLGDIVTSATDAANGLSKAFEQDGIQGLAKAIGDVLADAAIAAAKHAPELISAGAKTVKAFVDGLYAHRGEIVSAAGDMAMALASGIADMLPKGLGNTIKNLTEVTISIAKPLLKMADGLLRVASAGSSLAPILVGLIGAFKIHSKLTPIIRLYKEFVVAQKALGTAMAVSMVSEKGATAARIVNNAVTTFAAAKAKALAAAETRNALATAGGTTATIANTMAVQAQGVAAGIAAVATKGLSAAMSFLGGPMGLIITAVGALAGAFLLLSKKEESEAEKSRKAIEEKKKKIYELRDAYKESIKTAEEQLEKDLIQINNTKKLAQELGTIVDANGRVKDGYQDRANFIVGQLKEATGLEIQMVDGEIQKYDEIKGQIDSYIEKKKAEIIIKSNEEGYKKALELQQKEVDMYVQQKKELDEIVKKRKEAEKKTKGVYGQELVDAQDALEQQKQLESKKRKEISKTEKSLKDSLATRKAYEKMYADFEAGNYSEITMIAEDHAKKMSEIEGMKKDDLKATIKDKEDNLAYLKELQKDFNTQEVQDAIDASEQELQLARDKYKSMESETKSGGDKVAKASGDAVMSAFNAAVNARNSCDWSGLGQSFCDGIIAGINAGAQAVKNAVANVVEQSDKAGRKKARMNSPSKLFRDGLGKSFPEGMAVGVSRNAYLLDRAIEESIEHALRAGSKVSTGIDSAIGGIDVDVNFAKINTAISNQKSIVPKAIYGSANAGSVQVPGATKIEQTIIFEDKIQSPADIARAIRKEAVILGLGGH